MIRALLIALALLVGFNPGYAIDFESLMQSGNHYYEQGDFAKAIAEYEKIIAGEGVSSAVHYNLGCSYFNEEVYGRAILHFEKARQLSPRDVDILHNLEYSKLFLKDHFELPEPMPLVKWFLHFRAMLSLSEIRRIETFLFSLMIIGVVLFRLFRHGRYRKGLLNSTLVVALLFFIFGGWLLDRTMAQKNKHGVLLIREANVSSAPVIGSSTLFVIHEGTSAEILDATDSWYEIRLADGKTGWIVHEALGIY